ncbi:MAG: hypothetical protein CUN57_00895, partial [Phototrophicales bacterium]
MIVGGLTQVVAIPENSIFDNTPVQMGDAIEKINGERFSDFGKFYEVIERTTDESITFSMIRNETGETYEVTVTPNFTTRMGFVQITGVQEESPAFYAGIEAGDLISHINGKAIPASGNPIAVLQQATREYEGRELLLTVLREYEDGTSESLDLTVVPRVNPPEGTGRMGVLIRSQFGIGDNTRFADTGFKSE